MAGPIDAVGARRRAFTDALWEAIMRVDAVEAIALEQLVATHQERELAWSS